MTILNGGGAQVNVKVKVKRLHPDAVIPQYATAGAAGFDLVAVEDVVIKPKETAKVPLGLAFEIPEGYELQIRPRSGVSAKTKLRVSNAPGTVDADFRGEVCVLVDNIARGEGPHKTMSYRLLDGSTQPTEKEWRCGYGDREYESRKEVPEGTYLIRKGDRIAQGVLAKVPRAAFVEVAELDETERGAGGFGSSGIRAEVSE
ncbi:dUTP diphosphatase [Brevibacillus agri]|uniref:dUTP diphosphatase n=1 Tax=Brevibacillus agri TaxID=51101 RepID=UPI0006872A38|nr:dUTP diphosphatase [Brevibacillus agri]